MLEESWTSTLDWTDAGSAMNAKWSELKRSGSSSWGMCDDSWNTTKRESRTPLAYFLPSSSVAVGSSWVQMTSVGASIFANSSIVSRLRWRSSMSWRHMMFLKIGRAHV